MELFLIFFFYLIPLLALASLPIFFPGLAPLSLFSLGLLLATGGSIFLKHRLFLEKDNQPELASSPPESELLQHQIDGLQACLDEEREHFQEALKNSETNIQNTQTTLIETKALLENKECQIRELEAKCMDLNYEIKTLLHLNEPKQLLPSNLDQEGEWEEEADVQVETDPQALAVLKKCLDTAQKITSANHFSQTSPRFRDFPIQSSTLDLRRLIDALRSETGAGVFLYSLKDMKALFVNSLVKTTLGYSPDQFIHHFSDICVSQEMWKEALHKLNTIKDLSTNFDFKSKVGQTITLRFSLGKIFTGVFRNHVIGVFYLQHASNKALNITL